MTFSFDLKRTQKSSDGAAVQKYKKSMISPLCINTPSRGPGASKNLEDIFEDHFGELERKDSAQVGKNSKNLQKTGVFFENFGSILTVFHSFIKFG